MSFVRSLTKSVQYVSRRTMSTELSFTFSSPAEVLYNQAKNVKQVDVSALSGSFGILANHVPVIAVLKPGVLTVHEDNGNSKKYFVSSGSVAVNGDSSVQVLAEEAIALDKLDLKSAQEQLSELQRALGQAANEQEKAEVQVQLECVESVVRAIQTGQ